MLQPDQFYHIYNHANGSENLFHEEKNYYFFLKKVSMYLNPYFNIYESYPDTVRLYYQKKSLFDGIDFALSPSLDSEKNKKLVRSRFIYNPRLPTKSSPMLPSMEIWFDLQIVDPTQDKELAAFLQQNIK
jgi:hypothetical protein